MGNPLFALELGRALVERGLPEIGEDIPVPDAVEDMLGTRVARLSGPVRRLLLAVALSGEPRTAELAAIADPGAVEDAVDAGLLLVDGARVRASHPLLAAAAKKRSRPRERRELHLALAERGRRRRAARTAPRAGDGAPRRAARSDGRRRRCGRVGARRPRGGGAAGRARAAPHAAGRRRTRSERLLALAELPGDGGRAAAR